jgi:hypothetical protein
MDEMKPTENLVVRNFISYIGTVTQEGFVYYNNTGVIPETSVTVDVSGVGDLKGFAKVQIRHSLDMPTASDTLLGATIAGPCST